MGDLKPLGSEKLKADEKLKRILELTYFNDKNKNNHKKAELVKESKIGGVYGIVKEKDGYYVKKGLNEQSLDYIGGMFMKNKNKFSSYAEALKRLELLKGQEEINEATKYVLKQKTNKEESPSDETPMPDTPSIPSEVPPVAADSSVSPESSSEQMPSSDANSEMPPAETSSDLPPSDSSDMSEPSSESKRSDYMAEVQKYAGKLGQELRDQKEKMESDDIKYVLNMIISAVDLEKLELEDLEEIGKKFERDEEDETSPEEPAAEEPSAEEPAAEPESEEPSKSDETQIGEEDDIMKKLEEFIETPIDNHEVDLSKYATHEDDKEDVVELDLDEIKADINHAINEKLSKYFK